MQADSGSREPVPREHKHEAAGAGDAAEHREARDPARPRLLRQPLRVLPGRPGRAPHQKDRDRQAST